MAGCHQNKEVYQCIAQKVAEGDLKGPLSNAEKRKKIKTLIAVKL